MKEFISIYQEKSKRFNEDIIFNMRKNDDIVSYLEDVGKIVEIIDEMKFLGVDIEEDESKFKTRKYPSKNKKNNYGWIPIKESKLSLATLKFEINHKDGHEIIEIPLFIPKLINNYYYILNGNKYYAIYQNVDSSTYTNKNNIILKSLLMPIVINAEKTTIKDTQGNEFPARIFKINLFKKKISLLYYYFANYGFYQTFKYFKINKKISLVEKPIEDDKIVYFKISKNLFIKVKKKHLQAKNVRNFIAQLLNTLNSQSKLDKLNNRKFWLKKLGSQFTKNMSAQQEKGEKILLSFNRILDDGTKRNLRIDENDKKDIFAIIRWMYKNYDKLKEKDNLSIINKRLRLNEYLVADLRRRFSIATYRIQNSKNVTFNKLKNNFNVSPMFLIKTTINSELARYNNAVNNMDIFNSALKWSARGPQAIGSGSKKTVPIDYRDIHTSHIGRFSLNSCSNSDPGMSGSLSPFITTSGFFYSDEEEV